MEDTEPAFLINKIWIGTCWWNCTWGPLEHEIFRKQYLSSSKVLFWIVLSWPHRRKQSSNSDFEFSHLFTVNLNCISLQCLVLCRHCACSVRSESSVDSRLHRRMFTPVCWPSSKSISQERIFLVVGTVQHCSHNSTRMAENLLRRHEPRVGKTLRQRWCVTMQVEQFRPNMITPTVYLFLPSNYHPIHGF